MKQVPLPPLKRGTPLNSEPLPEGAATGAPPKKRGIFRRTYRGAKWLAASPVQWAGVKSIRQGASFIGDLTARARARPMRDPRFKTEDEGDFDLRATAFSMGMTVGQLERRLADRRRQTAMMAYLLGVLGLIAFAGWLVRSSLHQWLPDAWFWRSTSCRCARCSCCSVFIKRWSTSRSEQGAPRAGESIWRPTRVSGHARRPETSPTRCTHH